MIQFIVNCGTGIIQIWLSWYIASTFIHSRKRSLLIQVVGVLFVSLILALINQLEQPFLNLFALAILYTLLIGFIFDTTWYYSILFAAIAVVVINFSEIMMVFIMVGTQNIRLTPDFFLRDHIQIIGQCGGLLISLAIVYILRMIFQKRKDVTQLPQNFAVVLFPITSLLTLLYILSSVANVFSHRQIIYLSLMLCIMLVVTNIASLIGNENVRKRYVLQNEIDAMHHQEELAVGLLHQQEEYLKKMRAQSHDFKNHLLCLQALVRDKAPGQSSTSQYIDELLSAVDGLEQYTEVQNESLRAIIINTAVACKEADIEFRIRMEYSDFAFMTFSDISVLFSNALDNAMEASVKCIGESNRFIDLKILRKGEMIFIQVVNSKCNEVKINNDKMISTKQDFYNHGIGFKNIERVIKKYEGNITMDYDEFEFRLYINLPASDDILEEQI